jgi:outer membrane protein insertion porin family
MMLKRIVFTFLSFLFIFSINAQEQTTKQFADYANPNEYTIDSIAITGIQFLDARVLSSMSGFDKGAKVKIPGDDISKLIKKYWEYGLFDDVQISFTKLDGDKIILHIWLKERPRLSQLTIEGVKKGDREDLVEKVNLRPGTQITDNTINNTIGIVKKFYIEKGFFNVNVDVIQKPDTTNNRVNVTLNITKNKRVKIKNISFTGNEAVIPRKLRKQLKDTKRRDWNIFHGSKYIESKYKDDKIKLIDYYNEKGYRDATIITDSIEVISPKRIIIHINLFEGHKYYFRDVKWVGNTKYSTEMLSFALGIKKGDVFDQKMLDKRLQQDEDAVSSIYLDNGYLFFNVTPVETKIENDSIDFEMRIFEGNQATINNIYINGNTKTNEHVVRRELRTLPGELFSRTDIIRTVRELASMGHFEPEKIEPNPIPNPANSTVDIEYNLVERANDQLEISGGWGGYTKFVGTIGLRFTNFSSRNFFKLKEWRPIPSGDGQTLSLRAQTNGKYYRAYNISFVEPWFGGKKPNSLSLSAYYSKYTSTDYITQASDKYMIMTGGSVGLGRRLTWPDDYFSLLNEVSYELYIMHNYNNYNFGFSDGNANNFSFSTTLSRNSTDQFIYPRSGSVYTLKLKITPPYSLFKDIDYSKASVSEKYNWMEYHKWTFKTENYTSLIGNLVIMTRAQFGLLGMFNKQLGHAPFENFDLGGGGMNFSSYNSSEIVGLRGYEDGSLTPRLDDNGNVVQFETNNKAGNIYDKFTAELRYPVTLKEQAAIYVLAFAEGGNAWTNIESFNPYILKRSVGFGFRAFLPMFGMLGFDFGYGFDKNAIGSGAHEWQTHFTMGQTF